MHWFAVIAVGALVKKLVVRHLHGTEVARILADPPDVRTLVRFELDETARAPDLLAALSVALAPILPGCQATSDAIRAQRPDHDVAVDVLRLVHRGDALYTLELTRAWTGVDLDDDTCALLAHIHDVLGSHAGVHAIAWHCRQDRALEIAHPVPVAVGALAPG